MQRATSNILSFATLASIAVGVACSSSGSSNGSGSSTSGSNTSGSTSGSNSTGSGSGSATTGSTSGTTPSTGSSSGAGSSPCGAGASTTTVSLKNDLMPIIQSNCSIGGTVAGQGACHADPDAAGANEPGGSRQYFGPPTPPLSATTTPSLTTIYQGFVKNAAGKSVPSLEDPSMAIVEPGNPAMSFLWLKLTTDTNTLIDSPLCSKGDLGSCGSQMPLPYSADGGAVSPIVTPLAQSELDIVCNWISQGALNN